MSKVKLTDREITLLRECDDYSICDAGGVYYRLGGYGTVPVRYSHMTLPNMATAGLINRSRGYYKITDLGRAALAEHEAKP